MSLKSDKMGHAMCQGGCVITDIYYHSLQHFIIHNLWQK